MILAQRILKIVSRPFNRSGQSARSCVTEGIPQGLSFDLLNEICLEKTGELIKRASCTHLSGWKEQGAFRISVENYRGDFWQVIYKNATYKLDDIPALEGFPLSPGPSEYHVYSNANAKLARYLPEVFYCNELDSGERYQYLLEDLSIEYTAVSTKDNSESKLAVVAALPEFHGCLRDWSSEVSSEDFIHYDFNYAFSIIEYANRVLLEYKLRGESKALNKVMDLWPAIVGLLTSREREQFGSKAFIHGDLNIANVLIHKKDFSKIKFIDWEWAGFGSEMADLVSLFRRSDEATNNRIMEIYADNSAGNISANELHRTFQWCRLERSLLDAVYIAAQHMGSAELSKRRPKWAPTFVDKSLWSMLDAVNSLLH